MKQAHSGSGEHRLLWLGTILVAGLFLLCRPAAALAPGDTITTDTTLTSDIVDPTFTGYVISIGADNITLDGAGHLIDTPNADIVVHTGGHTGVTIKNLRAHGSAAAGVGLALAGSRIRVSDVDVSGAGDGVGVQIGSAGPDLVLERVQARQRAWGIWFHVEGEMEGSVISGCDCSGSQVGIGTWGYGIYRSFTLSGNDVRNCTDCGMLLANVYDTDIDGDNLFTGCANGISVVSGGPYAVPLGNSVRVHDVDVSGVDDPDVPRADRGIGVGVYGAASGVLVERVQARHRATGIYCYGDQQGNVASECDCSGSQYGILYYGIQQLNTATGCDCSGCEYGISSVPGQGVECRGFTLSGNDVSDCTQWGMALYSFYDTEVSGDNLFTGCANGIVVDGSGMRIHDVDVSGSGGGWGILAANGASHIAIERVLARQRTIGIYFYKMVPGTEDQQGNVVSGCVCSGSGIGIASSGYAGAYRTFRVTNNDVSNCTQWGMQLDNWFDTDVGGDNLFSGCANGLWVYGTRVRIQGVDVSGVGSGVGMRVGGSSVVVSGVRARQRGTGILLGWDSQGIVISGCVCAGSEIGIWVGDGDVQQANSVTSCDCSGCYIGIGSQYGSHRSFTLSSNDLRNCTGWGMTLGGFSDTDVGGDNLFTGCANGIGVNSWGGTETGLRIHDVDVSGTGSGIGVGVGVDASHVVLERVRARRRGTGIYFLAQTDYGYEEQQGNVATGCDCSDSQRGIVCIQVSRWLTLSGNDLRNCSEWGILGYGVCDSEIGGDNLFAGCATAIHLGGGENVRVAGVDLSGSDNLGTGLEANELSGLTLDGVTVRGRATALSFANVSGEVRNARLEGNTVGIRVADCPNLTIRGATIAGNTDYGVQNTSTQTVDARGNWWGSETGPTDTNPPNSLGDGIGPNPGGQGDKVTDYVRYESWTADSTPPTITASADPTVLWPPNGKEVPVTLTGTITDAGSAVASASFTVVDEYGSSQPEGQIAVGPDGSYTFTVRLEASRRGQDRDGRRYTVTVTAVDVAGNTGTASVVVAVPHDQRR